MQGVTRSQDPELGPAVSKYPPSSGYGDSHARTHTYGHMHRDQQFSAPEAVNGLYPSGFPRQPAPHRRTSRTADRMMFRFKQDPDVELKPVVPGTMVRTRHVMTKTFRTSISAPACCCSVLLFGNQMQVQFRMLCSHPTARQSCTYACCRQMPRPGHVRSRAHCSSPGLLSMIMSSRAGTGRLRIKPCPKFSTGARTWLTSPSMTRLASR